jgi:lipoprotein NlpD
MGRSHAPASVVRPPAAGAIHRVQRGDTLYSIAFRNGLDYRELARINQISAPFTIYVGQEIRLDARPAEPPRAAAASKPPPAPVTTSAVPPPSKPLASNTVAPTATVPAPIPSTPPPTATPVKPVVAAPPPATAAASGSGIAWRWPADGQRVAGYVAGDQTKQGIDIAGKAGDPVRAAADGEIVYSGNGLIGYGELIIVKHNASLLSAYGHNRRRLVQEGDKVKAGQQIAEMGSSSASRDMLHFEIRKNGKPVDPLGFLPAR